MKAFDADGHVEESVAMFQLLDKEYYDRRPIPLAFSPDTAYRGNNAVWLINGEAYPKLLGKGGVRFSTPTTMENARQKPSSIPAQEMTDVAARLRDLDRFGIDKQVVFPTLFLTTTSEELKLEAALLRAYNTFVAQACATSQGRVKFACIVPIRDVEASIRELQRARSLGAVAVMLLGVAWDRNLGDRDLYPFYEAAANLDMPVCIHFGWGCPAVTNAFDASATFNSATLPVLMGVRSVLQADLLEAIPRLRLAFLETGAAWVPWMLQQIRRGGRTAKDPSDYFREGRVFVACEADEDINYLVNSIGEDCFVVASDYPHGDPSHEDNIMDAILGREDLSDRVREKILSTNPQSLYGA